MVLLEMASLILFKLTYLRPFPSWRSKMYWQSQLWKGWWVKTTLSKLWGAFFWRPMCGFCLLQGSSQEPCKCIMNLWRSLPVLLRVFLEPKNNCEGLGLLGDGKSKQYESSAGSLAIYRNVLLWKLVVYQKGLGHISAVKVKMEKRFLFHPAMHSNQE